MSKIIAFCNQKGGTGKTTTAVNLAGFLAISNKKSLLIDLDPQSNATSGIGIDKRKISKSTYHAIIQDIPIEDIIKETNIKNFCIAPSNPDLTGAEVELVALLSREQRLRYSMQNIKEKFDFILIDCPPSLGLLTLNGLCAAESVIIPVQCEYYALEGLTQLIDTINLIKDRLNTNLYIEGVLLTMADFRTNLTKEVIEETRSFFKEKVYNTIIPRNIRLSEAPSFGRPIFLYDRYSIGCQKYWELCCEVLGVKASEFQLKENQIIEPSKEVQLKNRMIETRENISEGVK